MDEIVLALENVSADEDRRPVLDRVSLSVREGSVYVLLGREGAGKSAVLRCLLGRQKPSSGKVSLFGKDPRRHRREWGRRVRIVSRKPPEEPSTLLAHALGGAPDLLVLDDPTSGMDAVAGRTFFEELSRQLAQRPTTVFATAGDPAATESIASHIGILNDGRLVLDQGTEELKSSVRKITYRNEITESRTDYGTELDEFDAVRVRVRGWGIEALVRDYEENKFERFAARDGVVDAAVAPASLEEIFLAVAGR